MGTLKGGPLESPLLRSPRGEVFGGSTISSDNPDRVVFRIIHDDSVTFMGVMSHVGNEHQGFMERELVVSDLYLEKMLAPQYERNTVLIWSIGKTY